MITLTWIALLALPPAKPMPPMPIGPAANFAYRDAAPPAVIYEELPSERQARMALWGFSLVGAFALLLWTAVRVERKHRPPTRLL